MLLNAFTNKAEAEDYIAFLSSTDGYFQRHLLGQAIRKQLAGKTDWNILDAGCGTGWLSQELREAGLRVEGCDQSTILLAYAQKNIPGVVFTQADLSKPLPYPAQKFNAVILNMTAQDVPWLAAVYANVRSVLHPHGKLIVTIPNPYYAFPKAVWKRGVLGRILNRKPTLQFAQKKFPPLEGKPVATFARPLSDYINQAVKQKLILHHMHELRAETDTAKFGLQYQMFRYPLILLLEFGVLPEERLRMPNV